MNVVRRIDPACLVFLDEAGANASMGRSHAWIPKGTELVDRRPMNWGVNLTMLGALRLTGWVTMSTQFQTANGDRFVEWLRTGLMPKLNPGDVIVLDNAKPHHDKRVADVCADHGVRVLYLPPYSPDFNPIESGWALIKKRLRAVAPRDRVALRRVARGARHCVLPLHCEKWFEHAGYRRPRK